MQNIAILWMNRMNMKSLRWQKDRTFFGDLNKYPTELSGGMAKRVAFCVYYYVAVI